MEQAFLRLTNINKSFGKAPIIKDFNLTLPQGSMTTLLGPSGCGKTTILRLIAGLEQPTSGQIWLENNDITDTLPQLRDIGFVFQSYALFPHLTLGENVEYSLKMQGIAAKQRQERVKATLELVDLDGLENRRIEQLSGGQQQRGALARALIQRPKVLLFDEPLSNLDANLRRSMREKIRQIQQQLNITALYVTHDQTEAFAVSDNVVVMKGGEIIQQGTPQALYRSPNNIFMAKFMGDVSFFNAIKVGDKVIIGKNEYRLPPEKLAQMDDGKCLVGVRPEAVKISHSAQDELCDIERALYMGSHWEINAKWQNQLLIIHAPLSDFNGQEKQCHITFKTDELFILRAEE